MKKYCLTSCAKARLSRGKEFILDAALTILVFSGMVIMTIIAFLLIGVVVQVIALFTGIGYYFHIFPLGVGFIFTLGTLIGSAAIYWIFLAFRWLYRMLFYVGKNITMNIIAPEQADCRLFEECKKEI